MGQLLPKLMWTFLEIFLKIQIHWRPYLRRHSFENFFLIEGDGLHSKWGHLNLFLDEIEWAIIQKVAYLRKYFENSMHLLKDINTQILTYWVCVCVGGYSWGYLKITSWCWRVFQGEDLFKIISWWQKAIIWRGAYLRKHEFLKKFNDLFKRY